MKDRAYIAHATLAVIAIILAALAAWMPTATGEDDSVVMVPGKPEKLSRVEWYEELYQVVLTRTGDAGEDIKVSVTKKEKPPAEGEAPPAVEKTYPGSKKAKELFEQLAPLKGARSLGHLDEAQLEGLGLVDPANRLVLRSNGDERTVELGSATYGSGDRYARAQNGEVFLLRSGTISGLSNGAASMLDRRAIAVESEKVRRVTITVGPRGREVIQRYAEDPKKAFFADPAEPDVKLEQVSNWLDRILKLHLADVVRDEPTGPVALDLEVFNGGTSLGRLQLWEPREKVALARSAFYDSPISISISKANAEAILKDIEAVLAEGR